LRVTFLTHYFPPEVGAPQARIAALARGLAARGVEVTVHTGFPNYPDGVVKPPYRNRPLARERRDGIAVVRTAVYAAPNAGFARRLANHLSFALSALAGAPATPPADVVVAETPPLFTAGAAIAYAGVKRAGLLVNVADRWPASAVELGALRSPAAIRAAVMLEHACYRAADVIAVPTAGLEHSLGELPQARGKVVRIDPAVDLERFDPTPPAINGTSMRVLYAGTLGLAQGVDTLISAARIAGSDVVEVKIAGGGAEAGVLDASENVKLLGLVEHERVPGLYAEADAGVVLLRDKPLFAAALPTKLLEVMAAGRPVILSARGEAGALVERARAGLVVPPEDPGALADAFVRLAQDAGLRRELGANARRFAERELGREQAVSAWLAAIERAAP
jgi:glycosyltransferase involved in cell wall biosynthesis